MIIITQEQLLDYISCPAYYRLKHEKKLESDGIITLPKLLNRVARYFYLKILSGDVPSTYSIKKQWDGICNKYSDYVDEKRGIQGIDLLMKLYRWAEQNKIIVADINSSFELPFTIDNEGYVFKGTIGTVLAKDNKKFELLITDFSSKIPEQSILDLNLSTTLSFMAFKRMYGVDIVGAKVYNVRYGKELYTNRGTNDYSRAVSIIKNVTKSIKQDLWYPHENPLCSKCTVFSFCHRLK